MYKNKKAISDVVSTVLIILLVVAAIAIIGAIVLNTVNKTSQKVDIAVSCQTLDVKPVSCVAIGTGGLFKATVSRGSGGSDITLTTVKVIFQGANGATVGTPDDVTAPAGPGLTAQSDSTATGATSVKTAAQIFGASESCPATQAISCA